MTSHDAGGTPATDASARTPPLEQTTGPILPKNLADSINLFARDLHRELAKSKGNLFYSPLSLSIGLAMTYAGARGETAEEIAKVLHLGADPSEVHSEYAKLVQRLGSAPVAGAPELRIANRLWVEDTAELRPAFIALTRNDYGAAVEKEDFLHQPDASRNAINQWIAQETHGRLKDLLPEGSIDSETVLVLTNAIYFKGAWLEPFKSDQTRDAPFYVGGTGARPRPTMHAKEMSVSYNKVPGAEVVELPYSAGKGPRLAMVIILPLGRNGLAPVEAAYARDGIEPYVNGLSRATLELFLPRFQAKQSFRLSAVLTALGMPAAFQHADFSAMAPERLRLAEVHHQALLQTNESGSEAAAATAAVVEVGSALLTPPPVIRVDHPFLVVIRDVQSGVVLFAGRVSDPAS